MAAQRRILGFLVFAASGCLVVDPPSGLRSQSAAAGGGTAGGAGATLSNVGGATGGNHASPGAAGSGAEGGTKDEAAEPKTPAWRNRAQRHEQRWHEHWRHEQRWHEHWRHEQRWHEHWRGRWSRGGRRNVRNERWWNGRSQHRVGARRQRRSRRFCNNRPRNAPAWAAGFVQPRRHRHRLLHGRRWRLHHRTTGKKYSWTCFGSTCAAFAPGADGWWANWTVGDVCS